MKYIIWGTGPYCCEKVDYFSDADIVAFVERNRILYRGRKTILPSEIEQYTYDYIVVLSSHFMEIIPEVIQMGIDYRKIIPGIVCKPFLVNELEYISSKSRILVTPEGRLQYILEDKGSIEVCDNSDWNKVRKLICSERNASLISRMDTLPVGKHYGADRGGSICRYYLDSFFYENKNVIKGNVLEIGDRSYTQNYGKGVEESYVLHFGSDNKKSKYDFSGDLRNGEGIKRDFFDCIILTQVLNFVEDIRNTPDILIRSLKPGGKLLISVSGISAICRYDMDKYGQYWSFTDKSLKNMFTKSNTECSVWTKGNCKVACAFLQGMGCAELSEQELQDVDEDFQVIILAVVTRTM